MIEPSAASIPWMVATGNHDTELFSSAVAADHVTVANYEPFGYGGITKRMDFPTTGPSACPSVYSFRYGNVGVISLDANELSWEIQGLLDYSHGAQLRWLEERLQAWRAGGTSTSSLPSSTSARSRPATGTAPTAGSGRSWRRCSPGTRSIWRCKGTTTYTSARTR